LDGSEWHRSDPFDHPSLMLPNLDLFRFCLRACWSGPLFVRPFDDMADVEKFFRLGISPRKFYLGFTFV